MTSSHESKVQHLATEIVKFYKAKKPFRVFHGSTNSTRVLTFKRDEMIDISDLNSVLSIDASKRTAVVEPNVPMDRLVQATLPYGLIPPIVMEFPGITVGGAVQGNGGESSSFKWGAFNQTFNWYELITAKGDVKKVSTDSDQDLYQAIPGSAGTIALLTSAEVNLIPAKEYVQLHYIVVDSFLDAKEKLLQLAETEIDFLDGIMFSKQSGVVITGVFSDVKTNFQRFSRARDEWYYLHVEKQLKSKPEGWTETVPLTDYLFRYDRGAFWVGRFAFEMSKVPYNRFTRWMLDPILHTRKLYQALQESGASQQHVVQDLVLPSEKFVEFSEFIDTELNTYPLWLCPMLPDRTSPFQLNNLDIASIINVGVWGANIPNYDDFIAANRGIEQKVLEVGGKKWSYAHSYFTETEFWSTYDKKLYDNIREKYGATLLPTIYDKVTVKQRHPVHKKKAALRAILGLSKLKIEK
jgi:delta24-sterol reductase